MSLPGSMRKGWWWYVATWFGCGLSPIVSGTVGSLGALPFAWAIQSWGGNFALFVAAVAIFFVGCRASDLFLHFTGCEHDPKEIVVDEVAGQWLLLSFLYPSVISYAVGFVLFRAFDIIKPWPVSVADERIGDGFGVMFDDIAAALYPVLVFLAALAGAYCFGEEKLLYDWLNFLA